MPCSSLNSPSSGAYLSNALFQDTNIIDGLNLLLFFVAGVSSGLGARSVSRLENSSASIERKAVQTSDLVLQSI
jgi:hypothetical protein